MSHIRDRLIQLKNEVENTGNGAYFSKNNISKIVELLFTDLEQDEKENGWIPVSDRLPKDGTYITTLDGELVGQEEPFTGMCGIENGKWDDEDCVIAWMPLPEPYKED
nr:MAG: Protein of unknown function (DUF551) [Bacteriophage sp.]UVY09579.1 MAG: Protein of unknown function (DUF551) [Bacteriophage sp.]